MSAPVPLFQTVFEQIHARTRPSRLPVSSVRRLALLVTGLLAARHSALARIAAALDSLELTGAALPEHIERGLRRALNDPRLTPETCYAPMASAVVAQAVVEAAGAGRAPLVLAVDESSQDQRVHLFRVSLLYRGGSLPLVWTVWEQNVALPAGAYWAQVDAVLERLAALLPRDYPIRVVADRAFDIPPFIDRLRSYGWAWVIRAKAESDLRVQGYRGREWSLRELVAQRLPVPGTRCKLSGRVFKAAGWRPGSLIGYWAAGEAEPLVILTDLRPRWALLATYGQRFWIEAGFRSDKSAGWQWEQSRVQGLPHQERLLLAMAWASLVTLCLGAQVAEERLAALAQRHVRPAGMGKPRPVRESLFTLGLRRAQRYLHQTRTLVLPWRLPQPTAPSWFHQWYQAQSSRYIFQSVRL